MDVLRTARPQRRVLRHALACRATKNVAARKINTAESAVVVRKSVVVIKVVAAGRNSVILRTQ